MLNELMVHDLFLFALCGHMRWSKNVLKERHCPSQIILGSNDIDFCVLLNIGLYLECLFPTDVNDEGLVNCFSIARKTYNTKKRAGKILSDIFTSDDFESNFGDGRSSIGALLGSHSLKKCAATRARINGYSRDKIDLRGRWKHLRRHIGVAIRYEIRKGSGVFIGNLVVDGEDEAVCSNNDPSTATGFDVTDLNRKRKRQSAELQAVLAVNSQCFGIRKKCWQKN